MALRPDRLRAAREKRGLTQRDLSDLVGLGVNQISRYEKGQNDPSAVILALLCQRLDVSADYLLGLSDIPQGYATVDLSNDQRRLLDAYLAGDTTTAIKLIVDRVRELEAENSDSTLP